MANTLKNMKITIIILAVLLGLSLVALASVIICEQLDPSSGTTVIPDNYIDPTSSSELNTGTQVMHFRTGSVLLCASAPTVNLSANFPMMALSKTVFPSDSAKETFIFIYKNHAEDSEPFKCVNMFPGDSETNTYLVKVSHIGIVTVRFHADIRPGYEKLSEVLKCKIVLRGENKVLYDGLMRDMPESINHRIATVSGKTTELIYDITAYFDNSVGNEYMNKELVADFRWWVEEISSDPTPTPGDITDPDDSKDPEDTTVPDDPTEPEETKAPDGSDEGELIYPPPTGDNSHFCIWFWIAIFSLLLNIILLWPKRRRHIDEQEDEKANEH